MSYLIYNGKKNHILNGFLNLSNNNIKDIAKIKGLERFPQLKDVDLSGNQITEIKGLHKLTKLEFLNLSGNEISEIKGLDTLTNLEKLRLSKNQISEIKGLHQLTKLEFLNLSGNEISEIKGLDTLTNLKKLRLSKNQISEIKGLDTLTNLEKLKLSNNQISEIKGLDTLTNLESLGLTENQISEIKGLDALINLEELGLSNNLISEIEGLDTLTNLEKLKLSNNQISGIEGLDALANLVILYLSNNQISEIEGLDTLTNLESLALTKNQISEIKGLDNLTNLQYLGLWNNLITEIKGLNALTDLHDLILLENQISEIKGLDSLTKLETLVLSKNQISEIKGLGTLIKLNYLSLSGNQISEIKGLNSLKQLDFLYLSDNRISEIIELDNQTQLFLLDLTGNEISEIDELDLPEQLNVLELSKNLITDIKGLDRLPQLIDLDLSGNQITEIKGLDKLTKLKFLNLSSNQISEIKGLNSLILLRRLYLKINKITEIKGLDDLVNLEFLNLEFNEISNGKDYVKLLNYSNINQLQIDYHELKLVDSEDIESIIMFLKNSFEKLKHQSKINDNFPSKKHNLDKMIGIANILINLYSSKVDKKLVFHNELKTLMKNRINLEEKNSTKYFKLKAIKNVLFAGMEDTYENQLKYLEKTIDYFKKSGETQCEYFYRINYFLIKALINYYYEDIEECKKNMNNIYVLYPKFKDISIIPSILELISNLMEIQENLVSCACEPQHLERLKRDSSKKCDEIINEIFPQLQYSRPGIYRIVNHIIDDIKEIWPKNDKIDLEYNYKSHSNKDIRLQLGDIHHKIVELERTVMAHYNFDVYVHRDKVIPKIKESNGIRKANKLDWQQIEKIRGKIKSKYHRFLRNIRIENIMVTEFECERCGRTYRFIFSNRTKFAKFLRILGKLTPITRAILSELLPDYNFKQSGDSIKVFKEIGNRSTLSIPSQPYKDLLTPNEIRTLHNELQGIEADDSLKIVEIFYYDLKRKECYCKKCKPYYCTSCKVNHFRTRKYKEHLIYAGIP